MSDIFVVDEESNLFRIAEATFLESKVLDITDVGFRLVHDGTNLWIGTTNHKVKKIDPTGDMSVTSTHTLLNGQDIQGICESGDYIYVSCNKDENGVAEPKVIKLAKSDWTETEYVLAAIDAKNAEEVGGCQTDGTYVYVGGSCLDGTDKDAAVWKVQISDMSLSAGIRYTVFQSNRVYEDFQGFTIVDPDSRFTLWHHNCLDLNAQKDETSYIYKDFTLAHFDDFTHKFKASLEATPDDPSQGYVWMVATALGNAKALDDNLQDFLAVYMSRVGATYYIVLVECDAGALQTTEKSGISLDTDYFFAITKAATSLTCEIYSTQTKLDAGGAGDVSTLSLTITDNTFQYLYAGNTYNSGDDKSCNLDVENLCIGETTTPGGIITFYPDTTYIWAVTENGMFFKITKADLSYSSSAFIIPLACHIPGQAVHFESGYGKDGENFFVTTCTLKHLLGNLAENLGWQSILADTDGDWTSFACAYGASGYLYLGAGNCNEVKKVQLSDMSVPTTLTLSTGTNGINGIWISPS